jgi:hypothetical protein
VFPIKGDNLPFRVTKYSTVQLLTKADYENLEKKNKDNITLITENKIPTSTGLAQNTQDDFHIPNKDKMTSEYLYTPLPKFENNKSLLDDQSTINIQPIGTISVIPTPKIQEIQGNSTTNTKPLEGTAELSKPKNTISLPPIRTIFNMDIPLGDIDIAPMTNPNIPTPITTIEQIQNSTPLTELKTVSPHKLETNERGQKTEVEKMDQTSSNTIDKITTHTQQDKHTGLQYEQIQDIVRQTILELTPVLLETVRSTIHEAVQYEVKQAIRKHQSTDYNL